MTEKEALLKTLYFYPSDYISASLLSEKLGISKQDVYKYIRKLRQEGYPICGCTNRGYALSAPDGPLTPETLMRFYPMDREKIRIFSSVPSTNTIAKEMAACGAPEGTICIAEAQTGGRGRMGRQFFSPRNSGVYMSLILRPGKPSADALKITTLAAVAVSEAAEILSGQPVQIKWVNDVFKNERKFCGILAEGSFCPETGLPAYVILGIGLNVYPPKEGFPSPLQSIAGSLLDAPTPLARSRIIALILERFFSYYHTIEKMEFLEPYRKRMFLTGKSVEVLRGAERFPTRVLGVNDDFSLEILHADGTRARLSSGEVSLKLT